MGKTKIQWADYSWNPWIGCSKVADGCKFCYAEELMDHRYHRVRWGLPGTRERTKTWKDPIKWNRQAARTGQRPKVFCASLCDVFEDHPALPGWRRDLFELIDQCGNLDWLVLTKRPENIREMYTLDGKYPYGRLPLRENVWLGTSIASQKDIGNLDILAECSDLCQYIFLSVEPQIGPVNLDGHPDPNWVICGGESKQGHGQPRPFRLAWAESLLEQCEARHIPFFMKQVGSDPIDLDGNPMDLRDSHGGDMAEWPEWLRVRQCPENYLALV